MLYTILPSILSANVLNLEQEVLKLSQGSIGGLHLDVMDHHYVPNLTFGSMFCEAINKRFPNLMLDVHLMTYQVDTHIAAFAKAGASRISIHPDATIHLDRSLSLIKSHNCKAGLVLNPATGVEALKWCAHKLDFVLVMTVNPGFGGQTLIADIIPKIAEIKANYPKLAVCVDGGITTDNIHSLKQAGASEFVVGSAIFKQKNFEDYIESLIAK